ncbi:MAG: crAss001_48 related protein [Sarcina sp.]
MKNINELLNSKDYKDRFKGEYYQLEDRVIKLGNMLDKWEDGTLEFEPICEKELLKQQFFCMQKYLSILELRAWKERIDLDK